jgi:hypothetical protein
MAVDNIVILALGSIGSKIGGIGSVFVGSKLLLSVRMTAVN